MSDWVERDWGKWRVIEEWKDPHPGSLYDAEVNVTTKLKELVVNPQSALSLQRHEHRNEFWVVQQGNGTFIRDDRIYPVGPGDTFLVPKGDWHQIINGHNYKLIIVETQWGTNCNEDDIERK